MARPGKLICIGLNYRAHAEEAGLALPESPLCFAKWPSSIIGDGEAIALPSVSDQIDFEAELAVVIGTRARNVDVATALEHVSGYACFNDVSARDIQMREGQWSRSKSFDTFAPMGAVVPAADVGDPQSLAVRCLINGETMQDGNTSDMVFSVAEIIAFLSQETTLEPGDVIATGTPAGIGMTREPARYLVPGDTVTVEIERVGTLTNPVTG